MQSKQERLIGLAARAGAVRSGETGAEQSLRSRKARLCLLASDASDTTVKKFVNICRSGGIPLYRTEFSKAVLGKMIGREERSVVTVEDRNLAAEIERYCAQTIEGGNACG